MRKLSRDALYARFQHFTRIQDRLHFGFTGAVDRLSDAYRIRLAENIAPLCPDGSNMLDVGCDDGLVSSEIMKINPTLKITGVDVQSQRPSLIPRVVYDGKELPFPEDTFDVVMSMDVLHHVDDIPALMREMRRVSRNTVMVKDQVAHSVFSWLLLAAVDYATNKHRGIECVYNYPSLRTWQCYFEKLSLKIILMPDIHYGLGVGSRYNKVFVLEKQA